MCSVALAASSAVLCLIRQEIGEAKGHLARIPTALVVKSRQVLAGEELLLFDLSHHAQDGQCQVYARVKTQGADLRSFFLCILKETYLQPRCTHAA